MANNITGRVWTLDTVGAASDFETKIEHIEFEGYTTATDVATVTDRTGRVLWTGRGSTAFDTVKSGKIGWVEGVTLSALTGGSTGTIKVYIE